MRDIFQDLNDEQKVCVQATEGPVLVLAGAGSGKTRVLTHRIACLIRKGVSPYNILAITFTNKAANEMKERLVAMLGGIEGMWVCTIHSMCNRILRRFIDRLGYSRSFSIYSEEDRDRVIKRIISDMFSKEEVNEALFKDARYHISNAKTNCLSPRQYAVSGFYGENFELACRIYEKYEEVLRASNALDFDDLLIKAYHLFLNHADVLEHYQDRFKYIHIDEFQDTNLIQYNLIKLMAQKHGNIFAVGDDDQSIYGWRGAEVRNIYRFMKDFEGTALLKLERNYRSTKKILNLANVVIKNNTVRISKRLWTQNEEGESAVKFEATDERQEAYYVASMIKSLVAYSGYNYSDIAVLIRLNALSNPFEQEFLSYGLPYKVFGGFKFYERKEIKDIIAYLRLIVNPFDEESLLRIINFPKRGIGPSAVAELRAAAQAEGVMLYDVILNIKQQPAVSAATARKIKLFRDVAVALMEASELLEKEEFISRLLRITGLDSAYPNDTEENINRRLNIDEFVKSFIKYFEDNEGATLEDFLASVTLISDIDSMEENSGVNIATIHSVKGLEFKVVFVCGLDEGLFPISRAYDNPDDLEEERRLMYVAITRAKERLYLTRAKSRFIYGRRNFTISSRFLRELEECLEGTPKRATGFWDARASAGGFVGKKPSGYRESAAFGGDYAQSASAGSAFKVSSTPAQEEAFTGKEEKGDFSQYKIGGRIYHQKFGEGVIVSLSGSGYNAMADIAFPKIGIKTFALKFAPIKLL
ncbi:MAG: UvrD-helicase domain-containing protein [Clostridiales bacterium]|nr:UvrD-helicase domain-containing protein [Clostridiales bacterium]